MCKGVARYGRLPLVRYLHPGSGELTRLKETLHWHILPEPAREFRTLKPRMNSIAKPSWPPGDNCWSLGARGIPDQVIFPWGHNLKIPQRCEKRYSLFTNAWDVDPLSGFACQCQNISFCVVSFFLLLGGATALA